MSCECPIRPFMIHTEECKKAHPRPPATKPQYSNTPDPLWDIYEKKQWCKIHGNGFYGDCVACLQIEVRNLLRVKRPTRTS